MCILNKKPPSSPLSASCTPASDDLHCVTRVSQHCVQSTLKRCWSQELQGYRWNSPRGRVILFFFLHFFLITAPQGDLVYLSLRHTSPTQAPLVFSSLADSEAGSAPPQIQGGLGMTSLPSPISSVINIWLCPVSYEDNRGVRRTEWRTMGETKGREHGETSSLMQADRQRGR